jgi:hypothetical protein
MKTILAHAVGLTGFVVGDRASGGTVTIQTDGSPGGIKIIKQGFNVDPILQKQADCVFDHDLQRVLAGYRRRLQAQSARRLQV